MAKTFKEILAETLDKRGISPDAMPVVTPETSPTTQTQPTAQVEPPVTEQPPVPPPTPPAPEPETPVETTAENGVEEEIPGFTVSDEPVTSEIPGFTIADEPIVPEVTFDSTTVVTPEMLSGLDYETIYKLGSLDSPLAPEQRDIVANALRGSSDLADIISGYDSLQGAENVDVPVPRNRGEVAKNQHTQAVTVSSSNIAVLDAVKNARQKYLKDNPATPQGYLDQVNQGLLTGAAAPIPEGSTSAVAPSYRRGTSDTLLQAFSFGFADDILGAEGPNALTPQKSREDFAEQNPGAALVAELGGAILSPSVGAKALGALGKGLKNSDKWYQTVAKIAAASGTDAAITAIGNEGDVPTEALVGTMIGGGLGASASLFKVGKTLTSSFVKMLSGNKNEAETATDVLKFISKTTNINERTLRDSIMSSKNFVSVLTENGKSVQDAGEVARMLVQKTDSGQFIKEASDIASKGLSDIINKSTSEVNKFLENLSPEEVGKEIGNLYKAQSGSDLAGITKKLMQTNASNLHSGAIKKAISDRTRVDTSILEGSGKTFVKEEDILIDKETGRIFVPNEGAVKLTNEELDNTPNLFGYAENDLFELTDEGNNLRGDIFQSSQSILSRELDFKEGQAPDQAFSELVKRAKDEADAIIKSSIDDLPQADREYARRKALKTAMELTDSFIKKRNLSPSDIEEYTSTVSKLSGLNDMDRKKAVVTGIRNFFASNPKTTNIIDEKGKLNPSLRSAFSEAGISKSELDMFEKMASDKTFFEAFVKSTGVNTPEQSVLEGGVRKLSYQLFFHPPFTAVKNTILSIVGSKAVAGMADKVVSKNYANLVKQIVSLDEKDFKKIQKLVEEGDTILRASLKTLTEKKLVQKASSSAAKYIASE